MYLVAMVACAVGLTVSVVWHIRRKGLWRTSACAAAISTVLVFGTPAVLDLLFFGCSGVRQVFRHGVDAEALLFFLVVAAVSFSVALGVGLVATIVRERQVPIFALALVAVCGALAYWVVGFLHMSRAEWLSMELGSFAHGVVFQAMLEGEEVTSFGEFFQFVEQEGPRLDHHRYLPRRRADEGQPGELVSSPDAPNPFPGMLSGERYGRLDVWHADLPPETVPLIWGEAESEGRMEVVFLDGSIKLLTPAELAEAIGYVRGYGTALEAHEKVA